MLDELIANKEVPIMIAGPVRSLCFGGEHFDELYATDGIQVFKRKVKLPGFPPWSAPVAYPSQGGS